MRTIGIEEEFLLVSDDGTPRAVAAAALQHASSEGNDDDPRRPGGSLEKEFAQEQIETSTHPCTDLGDLLEQVRAGRWRADASAQHAGARAAALGTSPRAAAPTVVVNRRAQDIATTFAQTARDQLTCGCHVHVEIADDEEGVRVLDHLRRWNPVLLALSTNSPFWHGTDTGYESFRSQIWGRWPTAGPTAPFGDARTYRATVDALVASGTILDTGMVYFDARLSARYPTVEVRVADVCLDPQDAVLLGALVRGLAETALDTAAPGTAPQPRAEQVRVAAWRAARSGLTGDLVGPTSGRPVPAAHVLDELMSHVADALAATGDLPWVREHLAELVARGNGAQQQRRWQHAGADRGELVRRAVRATLA